MDSRLARGLRLSAIAVALSFASLGEAQELKTINFMSANDRPAPSSAVHADLRLLEEEGIKVNMLSSDTTVPYVAFLGMAMPTWPCSTPAGAPGGRHRAAGQGRLRGLPVRAGRHRRDRGQPDQVLADLKDVTIGLAERPRPDHHPDRSRFGRPDARETPMSRPRRRQLRPGHGRRRSSDKTIDAFAGGSTDRAGIEAAG